jgi:YD repeat-containing protein
VKNELERKVIPRLAASVASFLLLAVTAPGAQSTWVYYDSTGHLAYQTWGNGNRIMDFSDAGYMGGGVALPAVPTVLTLNPSGGDDKTALQNAINVVSARPLTNGSRGALQLGAGTFLVSGQLNVSASGVVIRGAGSGAGGTTIQMTSGSTVTLFNVSGSGSPSESGTVNITNTYVPSGTKMFNVSSTVGYNIGDAVNIHRAVTSNWVHYLGMDTLVRSGATQTWISVGTVITTDRTIKQISGNQITLDVPLTDSFDSQYLGTPVGTMSKYTWSGRISQVGLEHFRILAPPVADAYISVHMNDLIDSWARDIVIQDGVNCFTLDKNTKRVTVDNVIITHTVPSTNAAGPSDFACTGTQIFYNKCQALGTGTWPFVTHTVGTGPIVVLNFYSTQAAGISPHQRWCTGILSDNCRLPNAPSGTQGIAYRNRGTDGSGHGWTTGWSVAWNVTTPYFLVSAAPGTENWCIGGIGAHTTHSPDPDGIYDSLGTHVTLGATGSLYLEQLRERLGDAALANIGYGPPKTLLNIGISGTNLIVRGTGGIPGNSNYVLSSGNSTLPLSLWQRVATNSFDGSGSFSFTTPFVPGAAQAFYRLQVQ